MEYIQARVVDFFVAQSVTIEREKQSQNFPSPFHQGEKAANTEIFGLFPPSVFPYFPPTFLSTLPLSVLFSLKDGSNLCVQPKEDKSFKKENI